ncbi:ABC transporter permease [Salinisphaera hydrothermalis]|uniref:Putative sugar transport system, permease n=1 Tax=Salinisphaera hydrothermalis (strain C41B8) TaxID=1304275 RepID=A0A084II09_SALHC|nr:ribose ABC transporter permease [Salinisphaera hydrothermalis]KEZ76343.1 putative sugar transport system, permease [Salinisphaera hydrothermalis C41B8]
MSDSTQPAAVAAPRRQRRSRATRMLHSPMFFPLLGFIAVFIIMSLVNDRFLDVSNIENVARQGSVIGIIAVGMSFAIFTGGIDLSVGPVMALSGTLMAGLMAAGWPAPVAIAAGLCVGSLFGAFNGFCVAFGRMPPIIVTLATMGAAHGLALLYTGGYPISGLPSWFAWFGRGSLAGIQVPILIMLLVYAAGYVVLHHTPFGRYVYAVGGNEEATRLTGIRVPRTKMLVYSISGLTAAIAGLVITARLMSGQPSIGEGFELDAIAAVVLGGAAISGGRGVVLGTLVGAMLLAMLNNGLNLMGVSSYLQDVIKGGIILLAVYIGRGRDA